MTRIAVFDYGAGNLHSLVKALEGAGREVRVERDPRAAVQGCDALVLPGVGAFAPAAQQLAPARAEMRAAILGGLPTLGICLGMQLLFEGSDEGPGAGLEVIGGRVRRLRAARVPQIGWNTLDERRDALFDASGLAIAYYANSFVCEPRDRATVTALSTHDGDTFVASVRRGACVGVQFHPEKSSTAGRRFLDAFVASVGATVPSPSVP